MADEISPSRKTVLGHSRIFTPEVINDIHMKAELGRYRMRGFSMFKKIPHWDELIFLPGTLTRFVIEGYREKCSTKTVLGARFAKKPIELDIPVYITGMSFGALSLEAKMALAKGASMAGTATCSGEGGMIPPERDLSTKWYYQIILGDVGPGLGDSMYDGTIYVGGKVASLGIDCVEGEWTDADTELIERKFRIYGLGSPPELRKFVCGKKLYNYDSLEPSERKLVL